MSSWASKAHAFYQPVYHRLSCLHHLSVPCPYQRSLVSFRMRSRFSKPSHATSSLDLMVTMFCGLILQICLIIALSFRCRCCKFCFVNGQVSLAWSIALHTQDTWPHVLKERWWGERTGSSSLNFFQAVFTRVVVESSQPLAAESMSASKQKEATTSSLSGPSWTSLYGLPSKGCAVHWHCVHL